jgi:pimeloyl-ACP methyl ester carboxylesterase
VPQQATEVTPAHAVQGAGAIPGWLDEVCGLADGDANPNSISPKGDVLVFVHGYNNSLATVLERQRRLTSDLEAEGWRGLVIGFDWPSEDNTLNYLEDRSDAAAVAVELVRKGVAVVAAGQKKNCVTNIHLLGHSTGAYVIMEAFVQAEKDGDLFRSDWRIGQVAFIGGDVSAASLSGTDNWSGPMFRRIMRLTNYSSYFDAVLGISNAKRLGVAPRAGRVGLPPDAHSKAVNVNCSTYFAGKDAANAAGGGISYTHSWYIGDRVFARDLAMTIEGAIDRHGLPTRRSESGQLFLRDAPRPAFQAIIETKPPRPVPA